MGNEETAGRDNGSVGHPLIDLYEADFKQTLARIENEIPALVQQHKEMRAARLYFALLGSLTAIHESLRELYSFACVAEPVLRALKSDRMEKVWHELIFIAELNNRGTPVGREEYAEEQLNKIGFDFPEHSLVRPRLLGEITYMLATLRVLVESDFVSAKDRE